MATPQHTQTGKRPSCLMAGGVLFVLWGFGRPSFADRVSPSAFFLYIMRLWKDIKEEVVYSEWFYNLESWWYKYFGWESKLQRSLTFIFTIYIIISSCVIVYLVQEIKISGIRMDHALEVIHLRKGFEEKKRMKPPGITETKRIR